MATPFQDVYDSFLGKITDFDLASLTDDELKEMLFKRMKTAISKFKECRTEIMLDDMFEEFSNTLGDDEIEILATLMLVEWYNPQINNVVLTKQFLSDKDYRVFSQANHLDSLRRSQNSAKREANQMIVDYTYRHEK